MVVMSSCVQVDGLHEERGQGATGAGGRLMGGWVGGQVEGLVG